MILSAVLSWLPALLAGGEALPVHRAGVRSMTVEQQLIIRVPVQPRPKLKLRWEEGEKGPKCLPSLAIARAALSGPDSVDFILRNRQRVRARLDSDCDGLDFYGDFYIQPEDQGRVCVRRDVIRSRVGATCRIEKFHWLVPK